MKFTAEQIAEALGGTVAGDPNAEVGDVAKIEEGRPGALSFLANPKYTHHIYHTQSTIVIVGNDFEPSQPVACTLIKVENAYAAFAQLLAMYEESKPRPVGVDPRSCVDPSAELGKGVYVGPFAVVGRGARLADNVQVHAQAFVGDGCQVGQGSVLYMGVKIYPGCRIGRQVTIHAGSVVGADGFGFAPRGQQGYLKVPQVGNVVIEDYVEIGANTTIDRATMGSTIIREGAKLDNLIQIAHNVEVGANTVIAAQTGVSGSSKIGADCMIGGQVGVAGHIEVADQTRVGAQSGIPGTVREKGRTLLGYPATDYQQQRKAMVLAGKLPEIWRRLNDLERRLGGDTANDAR